jgi:hypothetical protein
MVEAKSGRKARISTRSLAEALEEKLYAVR